MKKEQEIQRQENLEKQLEDFDTKTKKQLEKWTGMKFKEMIYDTDIDAKSGIYSSTFINKYLNERNNFLLYIEDTNGEKFGYYVDNEDKDKTFHFNLYSNGRMKKPMKYDLIDESGAIYRVERSSATSCNRYGDIMFHMTFFEGTSYSDRVVYSENFDYQNMNNALNDMKKGRIYWNFNSQRVVFIEMEKEVSKRKKK